MLDVCVCVCVSSPMGGNARVACVRDRRHACSEPSAHDTHAQRASHAMQVTGEPGRGHHTVITDRGQTNGSGVNKQTGMTSIPATGDTERALLVQLTSRNITLSFQVLPHPSMCPI